MEKARIVVKDGGNDGVVLTVPFESTIVINRRGHQMGFTMLVHGAEVPLHEKLGGVQQKAVLLWLYMAPKARKGGVVSLTAYQAAVYLKVQRKHVYQFFKQLEEVDLIRKVQKDVWQLNPLYVWWGATAEWPLAVSDWQQGVVRREVVSEVATPKRKVIKE